LIVGAQEGIGVGIHGELLPPRVGLSESRRGYFRA
jgi:hypothetical protein